MPEALDRDLRLCRNFLAVLRALDRHELVAAGVFAEDHPPQEWLRFVLNPFRAFLGFSDERQERCFAAVQRRLPEELRAERVPA